MRMFKNFKIKLLISVLIGVISSLYQIELKDELHVTSKKVMLSKNRLETFEYLSNLENYPNFYPNMNSLVSVDNQKLIGVGKRYRLTNTHLFGIGETTSDVSVLGFQKPTMFEYICNNLLMERNRLEFKSLEKNKTLVTWDVYSRRKSVLFRVTIGVLYEFYYSQLLRQGLFSLQFLMKR